MPSLRSFSLLCLASLVLVGSSMGEYRRPLREGGKIRASELSLSPESQQVLVRQCVAAAEHSATPLLLKAKFLALALQLAPEDPAAIILDGQLSRGYQPESKANFTAEEFFTKLNPILEQCLDTQKATAADQKLATYLGSLVRSITEPASDSLEKPWQDLLAPPEPKWAQEELNPGMGLTETAFQYHHQFGQQALLLSSRAVKAGGLAAGFDIRADHQLVKQVGLCSAAVRESLAPWHPEFPQGWLVELTDWPSVLHDPARLRLPLALMLDSHFSGSRYDATAVVSVSLHKTGLSNNLSFEQLCYWMEKTPASRGKIVITRGYEDLLADWIALEPTLLSLVTKHLLCEAQDFADVARHLHAEPPNKLKDAHDKYLQARDLPPTALEERKKLLEHSLQVHPQNLSARLLLRALGGNLPKQASPLGCLRYALRLVEPIRKTVLEAPELRKIPTAGLLDSLNTVERRLLTFRPLFAPEARPLIDTITNGILFLRRYRNDRAESRREYQKKAQVWAATLAAYQRILTQHGLSQIHQQFYDAVAPTP
jgi:hypothetical protein